MGGGEIYRDSQRVEQMTGRWSRARRPADQLVRCCGGAALSLRWAANPLLPLPVTSRDPVLPRYSDSLRLTTTGQFLTEKCHSCVVVAVVVVGGMKVWKCRLAEGFSLTWDL